jgi:RNA polymerase sigma factor for flagellar operon FliA
MLAKRHSQAPRKHDTETARVQRLVEGNLRLVHSIAIRVYRNINRSVELEELISLGTEGLIQAAMRFDPSTGSAFSTFAYYRIRGAIYDGLGDIAPLPRWMYRRVRAAKTVDDYLERSEEDRTEEATSRVEALRSLFGQLRSAAAVFIASLDAQEEEGQQPADESESPLAHATATEAADLLRSALSRLPRREADLIRYHYFEHMTLWAAGERVGVSKSWASRLHTRALESLRAELGADQQAFI